MTPERHALYQIFEQTPAAIVLLREPAHRIDYYNPAFLTTFPPEQWPADTIQGHTLAEVYPRMREAGLVQLLDRVFETGEPQVVLEMALAELYPGSPRYVTFAYQAYREQGRIVGVAAFIYDATEQVLARRANEAQLALVETVFAQAPTALWVVKGPRYVFELVNPPMAQLLGLPAEELLGRPYFEVFPNLREEGIGDLLDGVWLSGQPAVQEEFAAQLPHHAPGQPGYYTFTFQPMRNPYGQVERIACLAQEVTSQVRARQHAEQLNQGLEARVAEHSQQVREAQAETARQRADLTRAFEQAPVAFALFRGPDLVVEYANPEVGLMLGRPVQDILGRPVFEAVPDMQGQGLEELMGSTFAEGRTYDLLEVPVQFDRAHAGRPTQGYFNITYRPEHNAQGQRVGVICVGVEVTTQVLARLQVEQLNQELEQRVGERTRHVEQLNQSLDDLNLSLQQRNRQLSITNADLDAFIYTASHDLRAPMANIEGLMTALRQELEEPAPDAEAIAHVFHLVNASITRFQTTIKHLTDITRLQQAGSQWQQGGEVDLPALLEAVGQDLAPEVEAAKAQVQWEIDCSNLRGSAKDLRSICYNLLSNALKYRAPDRPPVVRVSAACHDQWLEMQVQDNGLGLSPTQQDKLFGLFQRLHTHVEGSGVGLYAIKKLVDNAGGTIRVASEVGVGSTFTVRLPQAVAE